MANRYIVDRKLPERTKLMFYFPVPAKGGDYYVVELPFFENVSIKESKKARYQKYSLISRSSNLYSYLGADSRQLNLSFNMTLPHLLDDHPDLTLDKYVQYQSSKENIQAERQKFLNPYQSEKVPEGMAFRLGTDYTKNLAKDTAKNVLVDAGITKSLNVEDKAFLRSRYGITQAEMNQVNVQANITKELSQNPFGAFSPETFINAAAAAEEEAQVKTQSNDDNALKYRIIDLVIYWTNIIRSSVTNYSKNPIYGPPVIRLRHGIMYQDVPCICTAYSVDYDEAAGYDLDTLLPRRLKFNLKLEEIRTGDFGEFDPDASNNPIKRDNLAGWESVVTGATNSMDPGYDGIIGV